MKHLLASMMFALMAASTVTDAGAIPPNDSKAIAGEAVAVQEQAPVPDQAAIPAGTVAAPGALPPPSEQSGNMVSGVLLSLGLGALLAQVGITGAMASVVSTVLTIALLLLAGLFVYRMYKRKDTPANPSFAGAKPKPVPVGATPDIGSRIDQPAAVKTAQRQAAPAPAPAPAPLGAPPGFDQAAFLRHATSSFIRMQAAWDKADTADLKEFTTPEVFTELAMQVEQRGQTADVTEVVTINAVLLGIDTVGQDYLASVEFTGMIKSAPGATAEPFAEVWNMARSVDGSNIWVLAGIQQLS